MRPVPPPPIWDPSLADLVRRKARQLVGRAGLKSQDVDDVAQDLACDLVARLGKFDPQRGDRERFVRMVVYRAAARILRSRLAAKRGSGREESLEFEPPAAAETDVGLRLDVDAARDALPADLQAISVALVEETTPAAAARRVAVPRATFYARTAAIRAHFVAAGLHEDFPTPRDRTG